MNEGEELNENKLEFHDGFDSVPQETAPPVTSTGNPSGQSSTPLQNRGPNSSHEIAELTAAVAQAKAENNELERCAEVTKLKVELQALRKRIAH